MLDHAVTGPTLGVDRISLCLIVGLVAAEATVLLGLFWI
ncbi:hypothetical protein QO001_005696 [Methylobacterium brachiatum]|uniref:Uncharacterized protein n=1 Tax=Methylobacterium brachiatum TaxID=269660 RepID=A0AAJ1TXT4_9HYPH|nr:hypothetical protein [Methylobacterium brachiatum]